MATKEEKAPSTGDWAREFGCETVSVRRAVPVLLQAVLVGRPIVMVGDTGQGKSDSVAEVHRICSKMWAEKKLPIELPSLPSNPILRDSYVAARDLRKDNPHIERGAYEFHVAVPATKDAFDFSGLPYIDKDTGLQMYARPGDIPRNPHGAGIFNFRELNRPAAARTVKPLIEAMESRMFGTHILPEGYRIIADMNVGDVYDVQDLLTPFFIRRVAWIFVQNNLEDWVEYMEKKYTQSIVIDFLMDNPDLFDNHGARLNNRIYSCPSAWETVHLMLGALTDTCSVHDMRELLSGTVGRETAARFVEFCSRGLELSPAKILEDYPKVQKKVLALIKNGSGGDIVAASALAAIKALMLYDADDGGTKKAMANFAKFFLDLPLDAAQNTVIELAPPPVSNNPDNSRVSPDALTLKRSKMRETLQQFLMFDKSTSGKLRKLNAVISKRSPAPAAP